MDKHQRKQMAHWEQKKSKTEQKFEERKKENSSRRDWDKISIALRGYTPHPAAVFARALEMLKDDPLFRSVQHHQHPNIFVHGYYIHYTLARRGRWAIQPPRDFDTEVRVGREQKDVEAAMQLLSILNRHLDRVDTIRDELLFKAQRSRVIQNCLAVKEELMMKAWHPDRVGRILETYGWEVLDNLFGIDE